KLRGTNYSDILNTINDIRKSYVTLAFGLVFFALIFYPIFLNFLPKYKDAFPSLALTSLTVVLYTNSFGYGTFLMAQNKEKLIAIISFSSLLTNIILAFILIFHFEVSYNYVIVATIVTYILYTFLCVYFGKKIIGSKISILLAFND